MELCVITTRRFYIGGEYLDMLKILGFKFKKTNLEGYEYEKVEIETKMKIKHLSYLVHIARNYAPINISNDAVTIYDL